MAAIGQISESLEDYLEIIYTLLLDRKVARVKDIAACKGVRMASVTSALKRLAKEGLVSYEAREVVDLTPKGEELGRKLAQRHEFLKRFLTDILLVGSEVAEGDACTLEHHLSVETLDRLVVFMQFIESCPRAMEGFIEAFRACCHGNEHNGLERKDLCPVKPAPEGAGKGPLYVNMVDGVCQSAIGGEVTLDTLKRGEMGVVARIRAQPCVRQRLVDLGVLPNVAIVMEGSAPMGDPVLLRIKGYRLSMRREEAHCIHVRRTEPAN